MVVVFLLSLALLLVFLLGVVQFTFAEEHSSDSQLSLLEAGYEGLRAGVLMSSSFFSLVALFVLFDLELVFLFPGVLGLFLFKVIVFWSFVVFVIIVTLMLEWAWYGLKWQV